MAIAGERLLEVNGLKKFFPIRRGSCSAWSATSAPWMT